jgi:hypothetical protein
VCLCFWQYKIEGLTILSILQILILKACRLYNVFGSGANHGIYAQFMAQSALVNKGCKVGLLRGAGTRMALWFYAMMCILRLKQPLTATIHQQKFVHLNLNGSVRAAVQDINNDKFWKCKYLLLRAVFPALRLRHYCDKSKPAMDKIFFLSHRTTLALNKSEEFLNDRHLFGSLSSDSNLNQEGNIVLGDGGDEESDGESVVFADDNVQSDQYEDESKDDESLDTDKPHYKAKIRPIIHSCLLDARSFGTGTSANSASSMSMPYQVGRCASLKMSKGMSWSN